MNKNDYFKTDFEKSESDDKKDYLNINYCNKNNDTINVACEKTNNGDFTKGSKDILSEDCKDAFNSNPERDKAFKSDCNHDKNKRFFSPHFDVLGSYTGNGLNPMEQPEQDSDDL